MRINNQHFPAAVFVCDRSDQRVRVLYSVRVEVDSGRSAERESLAELVGELRAARAAS